MSKIISRIQNDKIDMGSLMFELNNGQSDKASGADLWFRGNVRGFNDGQEVSGITYEAFAPLAEKVLREICQEAQKQWGADLGFIIIHRVGHLQVGECSVLVGVSSPHRDEAYQASRYAIEAIKKRAPIWKQEHYASGTNKWLKGEKLYGS